MAKYEEIERVTRYYKNIPIHLNLQYRSDNPPTEYHCLSWRTLYPSGRSNRRFYRLKEGGCWTLPVSIARSILEEAEEDGMLDEKYDDPQIRHKGTANNIIDSRTLSGRDLKNTFDCIVAEDGEPDWGPTPLFVIVEMPDKTWRKIMIVDTKREVCTFRSTTTDDHNTYRQAISLPQTHWRMDNAMQDASAAILREFLRALREL